MNASEAERRASNLDAVEALFRSKPLQWIGWRDFAQVGGACAWRSRIAECRTKRQMTITWNRNNRESCYMFKPFKSLGRAAETFTPALPLFDSGPFTKSV